MRVDCFERIWINNCDGGPVIMFFFSLFFGWFFNRHFLSLNTRRNVKSSTQKFKPIPRSVSGEESLQVDNQGHRRRILSCLDRIDNLWWYGNYVAKKMFSGFLNFLFSNNCRKIEWNCRKHDKLHFILTLNHPIKCLGKQSLLKHNPN